MYLGLMDPGQALGESLRTFNSKVNTRIQRKFPVRGSLVGRREGHGSAHLYYKQQDGRNSGKGGTLTHFMSPSFLSLTLEDPSKAGESLLRK